MLREAAPTPELEIAVAREGAGSGAPVYQQIADQVRSAIAAGTFAEGERLPTIRALAAKLGVHRDTVGLAYEALAADGVVEACVGRGTFVGGGRPRPAPPGPGAP